MRSLGRRSSPPRNARRGSDEREPLDITSVLNYYGASALPEAETGWKKIRCPFHGDSQASATFSPEHGSFHCFACEMSGDAISIIKKAETCDFLRAAAIYEQITGTPFGNLNSNKHHETATVKPPAEYESGLGFSLHKRNDRRSER